VILTEHGGAKIGVTISRYHLAHHLLTDAPQGMEIYNACLTGVDSAGHVSGVGDYGMALFHVDVRRVSGTTGAQGPRPTVTIAAGQQFRTGLAPLIPDPTASSDCTTAELPPRTVPSSGDFAIVVPGIEANRFGGSFWQGEYVYVDPGKATVSSCIQDGHPMAVDMCALGGST
jgi:hypothetical protein